jgi:DNA-binding NtrC family response regulator
MTSVLIIDRELGYMWALAEGLVARGIATIPSISVQDAERVLATLQPELGLLIVNCACEGICSFAQELRRQHPSLKIIGITSRGHRCRECKRLLSATISDPEDRSPDRLRHCVELVSILTGRSGAGGSWPG